MTGSQTITQGPITIFFVPEQMFYIARIIKKLFWNKFDKMSVNSKWTSFDGSTIKDKSLSDFLEYSFQVVIIFLGKI